MIYHIMYKNICVADVVADKLGRVSNIQKYIPDNTMQPLWGNFEKATCAYLTERFYIFLKGRCYEDGRANLRDILNAAGLDDNNPYEWIKVSHGVTYEDYWWVKIDDEKICWEDVKVRD